jgi:hypothetical protein
MCFAANGASIAILREAGENTAERPDCRDQPGRGQHDLLRRGGKAARRKYTIAGSAIRTYSADFPL